MSVEPLTLAVMVWSCAPSDDKVASTPLFKVIVLLNVRSIDEKLPTVAPLAMDVDVGVSTSARGV